MKRILIILMLPVFAGTSIFAQKAKHSKHKKEQTSTAKVRYTCSMHPEVTSLKPGNCPKCGMKLIVQKMSSRNKKGSRA